MLMKMRKKRLAEILDPTPSEAFTGGLVRKASPMDRYDDDPGTERAWHLITP
jgi:hypothetical protein